MKQVRILQIGMHDNLGGVENFIMNYYKNIDRQLIQFDFVNIYNKMCYEEEIKEMGGNIYNIKNVKKNPFKYYNQLKKILIENNYEIVHINLLSLANILPIIAAKRAKVHHIILHSHNGGTPKGILRKILNKINQKIIMKDPNFELWACSDVAGKWMFGNKKFTIIDNAIETEKFEYNETKREDIRKKLKIDNNELVIGHVGRFQEQKNHTFLIDIFNEIHRKRDNSKLLLIGDGELRSNIEAKIKEMNLENNVILLGIVNNTADYYQVMDVFLLPSLFEGLPIVSIEAQSSRLLCVMSESITREAKIISSTQFISLEESSKQWADTILNLYDKYDRNSEKSKNEIERYNVKNRTKELQNLYLKIEKGTI